MSHPVVRGMKGRLRSRLRAGASRARDERGQVLLVTGAFVVLLVGLAGLTTDVGNWLTGDRIAQKGADAAALAGAGVLARGGSTTAAESAASSNAASNGVTISFFCTTTAGKICVSATKTSPSFFSKLFGLAGSTKKRQAVATAGGPGQWTGVMPFVFTTDVVSRWQAGTTYTYNFDNNLGLPGDFGLANLCGGNTPA
jgi:Flp pilus assembly protein TadG